MRNSTIHLGRVVADLDEAMSLALEQAAMAETHLDVPVGAVVIRHSIVIAARHNERELTGDPTAHAELLAMRDAAVVVGTWRLDECVLVVTLEPCPMCAGAAVNARVPHVVFGALDPKAGAGGSVYNVLADPRLNHRCQVTHGIQAEACGSVLKSFFATRRRRTSQ